MRDKVVPLRVCIECHGQIETGEPYLFIPARRHCAEFYRHADCHDLCGALGAHLLGGPPRAGEMLESYNKLRRLVPQSAWEGTESLRALQRQITSIHDRLRAKRRDG